MMKINITILEDSISEFNRLQKGILKYTAFVPQTVKATKSAGKATLKKINYFYSGL